MVARKRRGASEQTASPALQGAKKLKTSAVELHNGEESDAEEDPHSEEDLDAKDGITVMMVQWEASRNKYAYVVQSIHRPSITCSFWQGGPIQHLTQGARRP